MLGAPENGMRLEILDPLSASSRYLDPNFDPCAVICTICGADRTAWGGLPLAGDFGEARVFLAAPSTSTILARVWRQSLP